MSVPFLNETGEQLAGKGVKADASYPQPKIATTTTGVMLLTSNSSRLFSPAAPPPSPSPLYSPATPLAAAAADGDRRSRRRDSGGRKEVGGLQRSRRDVHAHAHLPLQRVAPRGGGCCCTAPPCLLPGPCPLLLLLFLLDREIPKVQVKAAVAAPRLLLLVVVLLPAPLFLLWDSSERSARRGSQLFPGQEDELFRSLFELAAATNSLVVGAERNIAEAWHLRRSFGEHVAERACVVRSSAQWWRGRSRRQPHQIRNAPTAQECIKAI